MVIAGIVAGGTGSRMGDTQLPKQFLQVNGLPIIVHTINKFIANSNIDNVVVGINPFYKQLMCELIITHFANNERIFVTDGGENRTDTVNNIVKFSLENFNLTPESVFVTHDAVRPFVTQSIISQNILAAQKYGACTTAVSATDTIIQSHDKQTISQIPKRSELYMAQTPQSFLLGEYQEVYDSLTPLQKQTATDTCTLFSCCKKTVHIVEGDVTNIKITYPLDLEFASILDKSQS
ncbi:MAG: IspD/TarI family cytidylyltransferase [Oscillospiraceae bacterium]